MTDSIDSAVHQILAEIGKHGGATGVSFHQRPDAAARYPTEAILTVVRMLAEEAEAANHSAMAAGLRAMLEQVDPNLPIEIEFTGTGPLPCVTEGQTEHGYWWRYAPSKFFTRRPAHPALRPPRAALMRGPMSDSPGNAPDCITERQTEQWLLVALPAFQRRSARHTASGDRGRLRGRRHGSPQERHDLCCGARGLRS
jgi:hypothetical protein